MYVFVSLIYSMIKHHHHIVIQYKCPLVKAGMPVAYTPSSVLNKTVGNRDLGRMSYSHYTSGVAS